MIFHHEHFLDLPIYDFIEFDYFLFEAKAIGYHRKDLRDEDGAYEMLASIVKLGPKARELGRLASKKARAKYNAIKEQFKEEGWNVILKLISGEIDAVQALALLKPIFKKYYTDAFLLGFESSGVANLVRKPKLDFIDKSLKEELKYLRKFLEDIQQGKGKMAYKRRWEMYVNTLDHVYYAGKVSMIPKTFVIDWVVDWSAERCEGCRYLYMNSPYTIETLPTTPRAGMTSCLSNCKCKLRVRPPKSMEEFNLARSKNRHSMLAKLHQIKFAKG